MSLKTLLKVCSLHPIAIKSTEIHRLVFCHVEDNELDTSDAVDETTQTSTGAKRKRTETKDPNAPKRPSTAYIFFNAEMRPKVKEEHPELGLSERSKLVGKMWANLEAEKKQV